MLYCTYDTLNMFRALLCPSSGARDYMCVVTAYCVQCLVTGCRGSGAEQQAVRPGRGMLHFVHFCKPLKKKYSESCPSNQVSAAAVTFASDEKWRLFNCFFQSGRAKDLSAPLSTNICNIFVLRFCAKCAIQFCLCRHPSCQT